MTSANANQTALGSSNSPGAREQTRKEINRHGSFFFLSIFQNFLVTVYLGSLSYLSVFFNVKTFCQ